MRLLWARFGQELEHVAPGPRTTPRPGTRALVLATVIVLVTLAGCRRDVKLTQAPPPKVDFSGDWELNYQLSERMQESVEILYLMARNTVSRSNGYTDLRWLMPTLEVVELAESISRTTVLNIEQDAAGIEIGRGEDFPLTCRFANAVAVADKDALGTEICGWDHHQLVFAFRLPDGLQVSHRLTLGPDGEKLNVATTVGTQRRRGSFTMNRVYTRFEPLPDEFDCRPTVDGTRTCRRVDPDDGAAQSP